MDRTGEAGLFLQDNENLPAKFRISLTHVLALLLIYYPLSPEFGIFSGVNASQPKIADYILLPLLSLFAAKQMFRARIRASFIWWSFATAALALLFLAQLFFVTTYLTGTPSEFYLFRYIQYSFYWLIFSQALREFEMARYFKHVFAVCIFENLAFLLNFIFIDDPLNNNIIGTFRGSFDAGAFFVLAYCFVYKFEREMADLHGKTFVYAFYASIACNLLFCSSRTAWMILPLLLVVRAKSIKGILALGMAGATFLVCYSMELLPTKIMKIASLLINWGSAENTTMVMDASLRMRWENFENFRTFVATQYQAVFYVIGTGPGYFRNFVSLYGMPGTFDNYYLRVFSEYGLIGSFFMLWILVRLFRFSWSTGVAFAVLCLTCDLVVTSKVTPLIALITVSSSFCKKRFDGRENEQ